jgi:HPt (histidine-containing phosphotransfer) domain-containing protein
MSNIAPGQDLDLTFLEEIADGSIEFIVESIDMFLQHTPELLHTIDTTIAEKNWKLAAQAAHKLKPNLGFFGMPISQGMIQEVELMAKGEEKTPGTLDEQALMSKFIEVRGIVEANIASLVKIRAEKEALL